MNFKINSTANVNKTEKGKKSSKASSSDASSFADALSSAMDVSSADGVIETSATKPVVNFAYNMSDSIPQEAKERGFYLLEILEDLEKDILSGSETTAIAKLEEALNVQAEGVEELPSVVQELLQQIESRAIIELEKAKNS